MRRAFISIFGFLACLAFLKAGPTAPVNPADRNDTFAPETTTQAKEAHPAANQVQQPPVKTVQEGGPKKDAPATGKIAPITRTPIEKNAQTITPKAAPQTHTAQSQVLVSTGTSTMVRPGDHPVKSKLGSKFQSALNDARAASATRAEQYRKEAKMEKVNEFVPNAPAPATTTRAGSETKNQTP